MPADPIEYRVIRDVQASLRQIAIIDGYHHDVAGLAVKLDANQGVEDLVGPNGPRPFIVLEPKPETWDYSVSGEQVVQGVAFDQVLLRMPLTVHWINDSDPNVDESRLQTFFRGCADIEQALAIDVTRGGLALDTRVTRRTYDEAFDSAQVWAMVEIEMRIYRALGHPNGDN